MLKFLKINGLVSLLVLMSIGTTYAEVQKAWENPSANMAVGSTKPGYAQLAWSKGTVLPLKLRMGMVTMVTLPNGEQIADAVVGDQSLYQIEATQGDRTFYVTPMSENGAASDTNMIVTGQSGNKYIFYLSNPQGIDTDEISYSQVDVVLDDGTSIAPNGTTTQHTSGGMNSIFRKPASTANTIGVDGEDYAWIKSMKIDPSEFRFDLDIFVPNPDDYVIAPERVWRDKIFTYIDFGDKVIAMTQRPVVSLLIEGGESPVGFRTDGQDGRLLIVEAVGDMVLRSGQRIVCIKKREKPFLIADTASVMALAEANVAQSMMSGQSLNNIAYDANSAAMYGAPMDYNATPMYMPNAVSPMGAETYMQSGYNNVPAMTGAVSGGATMIPTARETAGAYLPQSNIPLIKSSVSGVAVEFASDKSPKALEEYWNDLLVKFSGDGGAGILTPYQNKVFFAIDTEGVGDLGSGVSSATMYRLRIGPLEDIDTAQTLCDKLMKFQVSGCRVVRIQ
ncbi:MAG: TrbG/VirB9 family P-type conjugative transfer protein [Alphaproteobacteria bacterium]|nr:TrbG/VirB9 family P-type conjugative transfer protein [Alphaproteobacteria bacterium]